MIKKKEKLIAFYLIQLRRRRVQKKAESAEESDAEDLQLAYLDAQANKRMDAWVNVQQKKRKIFENLIAAFYSVQAYNSGECKL